MNICNIDQLRHRFVGITVFTLKPDITYLSYQKHFSQREVEKVYILFAGR